MYNQRSTLKWHNKRSYRHKDLNKSRFQGMRKIYKLDFQLFIKPCFWELTNSLKSKLEIQSNILTLWLISIQGQKLNLLECFDLILYFQIKDLLCKHNMWQLEKSHIINLSIQRLSLRYSFFKHIQVKVRSLVNSKMNHHLCYSI